MEYGVGTTHPHKSQTVADTKTTTTPSCDGIAIGLLSHPILLYCASHRSPHFVSPKQDVSTGHLASPGRLSGLSVAIEPGCGPPPYSSHSGRAASPAPTATATKKEHLPQRRFSMERRHFSQDRQVHCTNRRNRPTFQHSSRALTGLQAQTRRQPPITGSTATPVVTGRGRSRRADASYGTVDERTRGCPSSAKTKAAAPPCREDQQSQRIAQAPRRTRKVENHSQERLRQKNHVSLSGLICPR